MQTILGLVQNYQEKCYTHHSLVWECSHLKMPKKKNTEKNEFQELVNQQVFKKMKLYIAHHIVLACPKFEWLF